MPYSQPKLPAKTKIETADRELPSPIDSNSESKIFEKLSEENSRAESDHKPDSNEAKDVSFNVKICEEA